jgi:hypothetical protein
MKFAAECKKIKPAAYVLNGDIVDGAQRKDMGTALSLREGDQAKAASQVWKEFIKVAGNAPTYVVAGTPYHTGTAFQQEHHFAELIGAEDYQGEGAGHSKVWQVLNLDAEGVLLNFAHHVNYAPVNPGGPLKREIDRSKLASHLDQRDYHCIVRSHVHNYHAMSNCSCTAVTTPCWEMRTSFMVKTGGPFNTMDIGGVVIWADPAALKAGRNPITLDPRLYPLPTKPPVPVRLKRK